MIITQEFFSYHLVSLMREISIELPETRETISDALIDQCINSLGNFMKKNEKKSFFLKFFLINKK
jgi:hypothetical protein